MLMNCVAADIPLGVLYHHENSQSLDGLCASDEGLGDLNGLQHDRLKRSCHMAEHAVLDRIVLRATRRVMRHANVAVHVRGKVAQLLFEAMLPVAVAAAT